MRVWLIVLVCCAALGLGGVVVAAAPPVVDDAAAVEDVGAVGDVDEVGEVAPGPSRAAEARATAVLVRTTLVTLLVLVIGGYALRQTGGGRGGLGSVGGSYYLVWLVAPMVVAIVTAHPLVLVVVVIGVVARPWLPDPIQRVRLARRTGALEAQLRQNPANAVAQRELAMIWIEQRRPGRALPLLEVARGREPDDLELRMLESQALALAERHGDAAAGFLAIGERDPKFRYGAAWLGRADALAAVGRWPEAEAALRSFLGRNSSSLEGHVKLARARARQGDRPGAAAERRAARQLYDELPRFQRRHQRWWYLRAIVGW